MASLTACAVGCGAERAPERPPAAAPASAAAVSAAPAPRDYTPAAPSDAGLGVVLLRTSGDTTGEDTLVLRAEPRASAPVVARRIARLVPGGPGEEDFRTEMPAGANIAHVELAYDVTGFAVDSVAGDWARVLVSIRPGSEPIRAWAFVGAGGDGHLVPWSEFLPTAMLAFQPTTRFYASLDDTLGPGEPPPETDGLMDLRHLETRGRWTRQRVRWPHVVCATGPDDTLATATVVHERDVWFATVDARGRPLVGYSSRGC